MMEYEPRAHVHSFFSKEGAVFTLESTAAEARKPHRNSGPLRPSRIRVPEARCTLGFRAQCRTHQLLRMV